MNDEGLCEAELIASFASGARAGQTYSVRPLLALRDWARIRRTAHAFWARMDGNSRLLKDGTPGGTDQSCGPS